MARFNKWKLNRDIAIVKANSRLEFPTEDVKAMIAMMTSEEYQPYYRVEKFQMDGELHYSVFFKFATGAEVLLFGVQVISDVVSVIHYKYNEDYHKDCMLLKWLCDLLGDKHYIYPKKKEDEYYGI
jgi:hypothetical protein